MPCRRWRARPGARRAIDLPANDAMRDHIVGGGITRLLYGGNAFLYHVSLDDYAELLGWMASAPDSLWMIPSLGPSFGRAIDQVGLLRAFPFPCAMLLPCADPRDAEGLEAGAREIAQRAGIPLVLYLKDLDNWGRDHARGLDAVARLVRDGVAMAIKYAVVRADPAVDPYLDALARARGPQASSSAASASGPRWCTSSSGACPVSRPDRDVSRRP